MRKAAARTHAASFCRSETTNGNIRSSFVSSVRYLLIASRMSKARRMELACAQLRIFAQMRERIMIAGPSMSRVAAKEISLKVV